MTTFALTAPRSRGATIAGIFAFVVLLSLASQVALPIPGTPVPVTLQPLIVVLAGLWLGPVAGAASMGVYLLAGALGLPVFAPIGLPGLARFMGPTAGYLFAYPVVAAVAGFISERVTGYRGRAIAAMAGMVVLFLGGISWLAIQTGNPRQAFALGLTPFAAFDVVKALLAAAIAPSRSRSA